MQKVFISHSWEDNEISKNVAEYLKVKGVDIWIDYSRLSGGDNLPKVVSEAIEWCDTLVLMWSKAATKSYFVELEWSSGLALGRKIIPCIIDHSKLPAILAGKLYINFSNVNEGNIQLAKALGVLTFPSKYEISLFLKGQKDNRNHYLNSLGDIILYKDINIENGEYHWKQNEVIEIIKWDSLHGKYKEPITLDSCYSTWSHGLPHDSPYIEKTSGTWIENIDFDKETNILSYTKHSGSANYRWGNSKIKSTNYKYDTLNGKFIDTRE